VASSSLVATAAVQRASFRLFASALLNKTLPLVVDDLGCVATRSRRRHYAAWPTTPASGFFLASGNRSSSALLSNQV
jgi:hypothetical protein